MSSTVAIAFPSLVEATGFLTYPLSLVVPGPTVKLVRHVLLSTLSTTPAWLRNSRLTLAFTSVAPPHTVLIACIAAHVDWSDWFHVLGGREFDLTIERNAVFVQVTGIPGRAAIWKRVPAICPAFMALPTSKPFLNNSGQSAKLDKASPVIPANHALSLPSRTTAQQLLHSDHEKEEADEIFAMISNLDACVISPTPASERFDIPKAPALWAPAPTRPMYPFSLMDQVLHCGSPFRQPALIHGVATPSPYSSPESSRPSSPSSSLLSHSSSQESLTSVSTTCSTDSSSPRKACANPFVATNKRAPAACSRELVAPAPVDSSKSRVQRYLYQGGQSATLTGGVMLGPAPKASAMFSRAKKTRNHAPRNRPSHHYRL